MMAMWFIGGFRKPAEPVRTRKRGQDRFSSDLLSCPMGEIVDLSGTGIRIRNKKGPRLKHRQELTLTLTAPQGRLSLRSRVVWERRLGLRGFEAGLVFLDPRPGLERALQSLAKYGFIPRAQIEPGADGSLGPTPVRTKELEACEVLGVSVTATEPAIRKAYRALARKYHPDVNSNPGAAEMFHKVTLAYHVLIDAVHRPQAAAAAEE